MLSSTLMLTALAALADPAAAGKGPAGKSLAVFPLEAKAGMTRDTADLLTEAMVSQLRQRRVFDRVVTSREVEAALGLEQQKQLLSCTSDSCVAEVAGSLDVSFILVGSLGILGESTLLNLKLISVSETFGAQGITQRVRGGPDALLDAVPGALDQLLAQANMGPQQKPAAARAPVVEPLGSQGDGGPSVRVPWIAGGVVGAAAPVGLAVALVGTVAALTVLLASYGVVPVGARGVPFAARAGVVGVGGVAAVLGVLVTAGLLVAASALVVVGLL